MPILMLHFFFNNENHIYLKNLILAALFFSWIGDVVLLVDKCFGGLFVFGLISFLIAHLFYIFYFWRVRKYNSAEEYLKPFAFFAVFAYTGTLYFWLFPFLGSMKIPVLIYSLVISLMLLSSFHAFEQKGKFFAKICLLGTVFFVVSDSILAAHRFAAPFRLAPVLIMLTYGLAQLFITEGSLLNLREIKEK